VLRVLGELILN